MTKEEIQNIYDYSKTKSEIIQKLNINSHQNGYNIDKDILKYFSEIGINDISSKSLKQHWLEIQKRDYELNPKYCEYCGKQLSFENRYKKCCNQSCATSLGNIKKGKRTEETKNKIKKSYHKLLESGTYLPSNQYTVNNKKKYILISEAIDKKYILNIDNYKYIDKYINIYNFKEQTCQICGKKYFGCINKNGKIKKSLSCCNEHHNQLRSIRSKESINKLISEGRFKGWQSRNILSYPEKFWNQVLQNNNIEYITNKSIKQENGISNYFLDFYIEINNRKIDLEIDGKQHNFEDRKQSDIKRDQFINSLGIEVYRIPWNEINSIKGKQLIKEKIDKFLEFYNMGVV